MMGQRLKRGQKVVHSFSFRGNMGSFQMVLHCTLNLDFTLCKYTINQAMSFRGIKRVRDARKAISIQAVDELFQDVTVRPQLFHFSQQAHPESPRMLAKKPRFVHRFIGQPYQPQLRKKQLRSSISQRKKRPSPFDNLHQLKPPDFKMEAFQRDLNNQLLQFSHTERRATKKGSTLEIYQQLNKQPDANNFTLVFPIGKGGFGKVWKTVEKGSKKAYAMKRMQKVKILSKRCAFSIMNEKKLLVKLHHPFMVNIHCSFQDREHLYLLTDYCNRGDLRYHLTIHQSFSEEVSCFFLACTILCLEYLHSQGVIHRDLKPQNMVLDDKGYSRVTDLGISRYVTQRNFQDTSGTPGYMAPEVICRANHAYGVDFYAIGVIAFQFMTGKVIVKSIQRPYLGANRNQIRQKMMQEQVQIDRENQYGWSDEGIDFINRLIKRKPQERLGFNGMGEVKYHSFFRNIYWKKLEKKQLQSPFIPKSIEEDHSNYKRGIAIDSIIEDVRNYQILLNLQASQKVFEGYEYSRRSKSKRKSTKGEQSSRRMSRSERMDMLSLNRRLQNQSF